MDRGCPQAVRAKITSMIKKRVVKNKGKRFMRLVYA